MKKIMFLIETLAAGGAEKVLIDIVNNLDKSKYKITVISIYNKSVYGDYQRQFDNMISEHINYKFLCNVNNNDRYKMFNRMLHRLPVSLFYKMFISKKYDIEIAFSEGLPTKIISGSGNKESLKYAWLHTDTSNLVKGKGKKQIEELKGAYRKFNRIIAVSKSVAASFENELNIDKKVNVKYNPIDERIVVLKSQEQVDEIRKKEVFTILSIGRLVDIKGYDRLLKVAKRLRDDGLLFKIYIIGDGEQRHNLERYILENSLEDFVELLGFQANPYKYLKQADLFVCSSRVEGFSLVVAEALILDIPVVSTNCAGPKELLDNDEYGVTTENNVEGLYKGIKDLITDKSKYCYYKQQATKRKSIFNISRSISEIEEIL